LGRQVIENLLMAGAKDIVALVRNPSKAADLSRNGVQLRPADYDDPASLRRSLQGAHVALFISNTDISRRAVQHENVVGAMRDAGVGRLVYTSFAGVSGGGSDVLSASHAETEKQIRHSGVPFTFLRDQFYLDAYVEEVRLAAASGVCRLRADFKGVAMVSRRDVARLAAHTLVGSQHEGAVYAATGPQTVTPEVITATAAAVSGRTIRTELVSAKKMRAEYEARGYDGARVQISMLLDDLIDGLDLRQTSTDIERVTGAAPESLLDVARRALSPGLVNPTL